MQVDLMVVLPIVLGIGALVGTVWGVFSYIGSLRDRLTRLEERMNNVIRERDDDDRTRDNIFKQLREINCKLDSYNTNFLQQQTLCTNKFATKEELGELRRER